MVERSTGQSQHSTQLNFQAYVSLKNETDKVIVFERAGLLFIFNCESCCSL